MAAAIMTTIQNFIAFILQIFTSILIFKRRMRVGAQTNPTSQVTSKNDNISKRQKKAKKKIESKLFLNSLVLFLLMTLKTIAYLMAIFQISFWNITSGTLYNYSADIFSLINPFLLLFISDAVRKMFGQFLKCQKYTL